MIRLPTSNDFRRLYVNQRLVTAAGPVRIVSYRDHPLHVDNPFLFFTYTEYWSLGNEVWFRDGSPATSNESAEAGARVHRLLATRALCHQLMGRSYRGPWEVKS